MDSQASKLLDLDALCAASKPVARHKNVCWISCTSSSALSSHSIPICTHKNKSHSCMQGRQILKSMDGLLDIVARRNYIILEKKYMYSLIWKLAKNEQDWVSCTTVQDWVHGQVVTTPFLLCCKLPYMHSMRTMELTYIATVCSVLFQDKSHACPAAS